MRIIGGEYKGKRLSLPDDKRIRPTADRTREALFNILAHGSDYRTNNGPAPLGMNVLDVFAGTGALGVEALSRGAERVTFMDNHADSLKIIKANLALIGAQQKASVLNRSGLNPGRAAAPVDLILMDPPYNENLAEPALLALLENNWIAEHTTIILELAAKESFPEIAGLEQMQSRKYGAAQLVILKKSIS